MRFTATIHPPLLKTYGDKQECEDRVLKIIKTALWTTTPRGHREYGITVKQVSLSCLDVRMELNYRDAETVKDFIYEALLINLEPEYDTDIDVDINNELEPLTWSTT